MKNYSDWVYAFKGPNPATFITEQINLIIIADNIQITNRLINDATKTLNPTPVQKLVRHCEEAGAQALDINSGPLSRNPEKIMAFLIEAAQEVSDLPIIIDTSNHKALEAGLKVCKKKAIINGFSLQPEKLEHILPLARKYNTDIIGYLLFPNSHFPHDASERLTNALDLLSKYVEAGVNKDQLIIDPVIVPILW